MSLSITITADTTDELVTKLEDLLARFEVLADEAPEAKPKKTPPKKATKPKPKPEPEPKVDKEEPSTEASTERAPEPSGDPAQDKVEAIGILMPAFSKANKDGKNRIMALAKDYGAKKFSEIPDKHGTELLEKAQKLLAELDTA